MGNWHWHDLSFTGINYTRIKENFKESFYYFSLKKDQVMQIDLNVGLCVLRSFSML